MGEGTLYSIASVRLFHSAFGGRESILSLLFVYFTVRLGERSLYSIASVRLFHSAFGGRESILSLLFVYFTVRLGEGSLYSIASVRLFHSAFGGRESIFCRFCSSISQCVWGKGVSILSLLFVYFTVRLGERSLYFVASVHLFHSAFRGKGVSILSLLFVYFTVSHYHLPFFFSLAPWSSRESLPAFHGHGYKNCSLVVVGRCRISARTGWSGVS